LIAVPRAFPQPDFGFLMYFGANSYFAAPLRESASRLYHAAWGWKSALSRDSGRQLRRRAIQ
jgi:hypothetical protein